MRRGKRPPAPPPPAQMAPFVQVLGIEDAIRFILAYGGAELVFANNPRDDNELVRMFGRDRAEALAGLIVPRRVSLLKPWLSRYFHAQGYSVARIARTLRVSDTAVRGYLRRAVASPEERRAEAERAEHSRKASYQAKGALGRVRIELTSIDHVSAAHPLANRVTRPHGTTIAMPGARVKDAPLRHSSATRSAGEGPPAALTGNQP